MEEKENKSVQGGRVLFSEDHQFHDRPFIPNRKRGKEAERSPCSISWDGGDQGNKMSPNLIQERVSTQRLESVGSRSFLPISVRVDLETPTR